MTTHKIIEKVSNYLGIEEGAVNLLSIKAPSSYKRYTIPKKSGGYRTIYHPSKQTKALQYALIELLLREQRVHHTARAYIRDNKSQLLNNVNPHRKFKYSLRIDFKEYFPSIKPNDLFNALIVEKKLTYEEETFITNISFINDKRHGKSLAIGAPSSPMISNIVMRNIDEQMYEYAIRNEGVYTRYADDLIFSTNEKGMCKEFYDFVKMVLDRTKSPKLTVNIEKTRFMSKGNKRMITGLIVTCNGEISIGRSNKRYIKKLIYDFMNGEIETSNIKYLKGYLSYILDVEPLFYNRLSIKYGEVVSKILKLSDIPK